METLGKNGIFKYSNGKPYPTVGWHNWDNPENEETVFYAEYLSQGVDIGDRVEWSRQLNEEEAKVYTVQNIFSGARNWTPDLLLFV